VKPSDTTEDAWKVQIEILRRKGPLERLLMACRMSDEVHAWERGPLVVAEPSPGDRP